MEFFAVSHEKRPVRLSEASLSHLTMDFSTVLTRGVNGTEALGMKVGDLADYIPTKEDMAMVSSFARWEK